MLTRPIEPSFARAGPADRASSVAVADAALASVLAWAMREDDVLGAPALGPIVLEAIAACVDRARMRNQSPRRLAVVIRRSLAAGAPPSTTAVAFDAYARCLVHHALRRFYLLDHERSA
jgi:hypothetical protein